MSEANNNIPSSPELPIKKPKPNLSMVRDSREREEPLKIQEQSGTGRPCIVVRPHDYLGKIVNTKLIIDHFNNLGLSTKSDDMIDELRRLNPSLKENPDLIKPEQLIILPENPFHRLERLNKKPENPFDNLKRLNDEKLPKPENPFDKLK